jgi:transposase
MRPRRRPDPSDDERERLEPVLPRQRPTIVRLSKNHRTRLNGIIWVVRICVPVRDLPERYGAWQTVYNRFQRWREVGIWDQAMTEPQPEVTITWP